MGNTLYPMLPLTRVWKPCFLLTQVWIAQHA